MTETYSLQKRIEAAANIRYIKLGEKGRDAADCIENGELGLLYADVDHDLCANGCWADIRAYLDVSRTDRAVATKVLKDLRSFYEDSASTLWITFFNDCLHWAVAEGEVRWDPSRADSLPRRRRVAAPGWTSTDIHGAPLLSNRLRRRLTNVQHYRQTICEVHDKDYLRRILLGISDPLHAEATELQQQLEHVALKLIRELHPKEFEILVDLIFHASGWRRISVLGEAEKDADLILEQVATVERAFVQVKARATPAVLIDYLNRWTNYPACQRMVFACHTPSPSLERHSGAIAGLDLWFGDTLAKKAVDAGLFGWLLERLR